MGVFLIFRLSLSSPLASLALTKSRILSASGLSCRGEAERRREKTPPDREMMTSMLHVSVYLATCFGGLKMNEYE